MANLKAKDIETLKKSFEKLDHEVTLLYFTQEMECEYCQVTREILEEVAALSDKIKVDVKDFVADTELVERYGIDKIPALVMLKGDQDLGVRFYGVPAGYEFTTLIEDILDVSGEPVLAPQVEELLAKVEAPVHIQVFVTPTCPYCPQAVRTAHTFAMKNEHVTADMVEVSEFPHMAVKYNVQGVPQTVINEKHVLPGAMPAIHVAQAMLGALGLPQK